MKTQFTEKNYTQTVEFEGLAEIQILQNSLQAYKTTYHNRWYNRELNNGTYLDGYNEKHADLIDEMYYKIIDEYIK